MTEEFVRKPEIQGYLAVRKAARSSREYSSDLRGDADIREYRHLPLEADPPRHTQLRIALMPFFSSEHIQPKMPQFRELAEQLFARLAEKDTAEVAQDLAMPYVMGCLGIIYNRPQDVAEWISWGPNVWLAEVYRTNGEVTAETKRAQRERNYSVRTQRSAKTLDDYLIRVLDEAEANPRPYQQSWDVWDFLTQIEPGGARLDRDELLGTGSVLLAGGRDTVVKLITGFVWHLIRNPADRAFLQQNPDRRLAAIHEMARYLSPLPKMERLLPGATDDSDENRVLLSFVSANHDGAVFENPDAPDIHREPVPNVAFGFGRHSCLGLQITEHETLAFLDAVLTRWPAWQFDSEPEIGWLDEGQGVASFRFLDQFVSVPIRTR